MAQITNFGKAWLLSLPMRGTHPLAILPGEYRMESLSLWIILLRDTYFASAIDVDHGTLALVHAQGVGANAVIGLGSHNTATPWYSGNQMALGLGPSGFAVPPTIDNVLESATLNLFAAARQIQFLPAGAAGMPFTVGGIAICLANANGSPGWSGATTTPGATEVIAIHEFTSPTSVPVSSSGQILTLTGGTSILSEA